MLVVVRLCTEATDDALERVRRCVGRELDSSCDGSRGVCAESYGPNTCWLSMAASSGGLSREWCANGVPSCCDMIALPEREPCVVREAFRLTSAIPCLIKYDVGSLRTGDSRCYCDCMDSGAFRRDDVMDRKARRRFEDASVSVGAAEWRL